MGKFYTQTNLQIDDKQAYRVFDGKKQARLGTEKNPALLSVQTQERKAELEKEVQAGSWHCQIDVNEEAPEDITALQLLKETPKTTISEKSPRRNAPCSCGSGKKYKKCCG